MTRLIKGLGIPLDDVLSATAEARAERGPRDGRICVCGHPATRHIGLQGEMVCKPTRMECPCRAVEVVLETSDTRNFLWRTRGYGADHALAQGLGSAERKGVEYDWVEGVLRCRACGAHGVELLPCAVFGNKVRREPARTNGLLCRECVDRVGVE